MKKILTLAVMLAGATTVLAATRITTRAELAAITNDLAGAYELGCSRASPGRRSAIASISSPVRSTGVATSSPT